MRKKYTVIMMTAALACGALTLTAGAASTNLTISGQESVDQEALDSEKEDHSAEQEFSDTKRDDLFQESSGEMERESSEQTSEKSESSETLEASEASEASEGSDKAEKPSGQRPERDALSRREKRDGSREEKEAGKSVGTVTEVSGNSITVSLENRRHQRKESTGSADMDAEETSQEVTYKITSDTVIEQKSSRDQEGTSDHLSVSEIQKDDRVVIFLDENENASRIYILDEMEKKDSLRDEKPAMEKNEENASGDEDQKSDSSHSSFEKMGGRRSGDKGRRSGDMKRGNQKDCQDPSKDNDRDSRDRGENNRHS